jgi:spore coat polysaccharide biosynthesis protein SpsF (cytidylyltransferase family)
MLAHVLERASAIQGVDQVVLAVPEADVRLVTHLWPHVVGGSEKDVLSRYVVAALQYEADVIVRVTGDCPLLASDLASKAVGSFLTILDTIKVNDAFAGYLAMCQPYSPVADGWDMEVFSRDALFQANDRATKAQREHVTTWMREQSLPPLRMWYTHDYTALKCSVDTREDLQRVETIMEHLTDPTDFSHAATWAAWEQAGKP